MLTAPFENLQYHFLGAFWLPSARSCSRYVPWAPSGEPLRNLLGHHFAGEQTEAHWYLGSHRLEVMETNFECGLNPRAFSLKSNLVTKADALWSSLQGSKLIWCLFSFLNQKTEAQTLEKPSWGLEGSWWHPPSLKACSNRPTYPSSWPREPLPTDSASLASLRLFLVAISSGTYVLL